MTKEQIVKEYLSTIGRKGGSAKGPQKARKLSREHYQMVAQRQRERWEKWRKERERQDKR
jgi:hypothetical protein